jgi:hypothetical protein
MQQPARYLAGKVLPEKSHVSNNVARTVLVDGHLLTAQQKAGGEDGGARPATASSKV